MAFGPTVGLDIGTQQIKVVEARPKGGRIAITALGVAPTPPGLLQNNIITDPKQMGQVIRQLLRESGISAKNVVGSVAGQSAVVVRIIEVPKMTEAELRETMKWEVERHVPFAVSDTEMSYAPLTPADPSRDTGPNMEVLLAVAQRDIISNFIDTVFAAGLNPAAIDIEPLAVGRAMLDVQNGVPVRRGGPPVLDAYGNARTETVAVINIGAANTDISIYQDGQLTFPRSLPLAGDSLTRAIADMLGYAPDQAERIKREQAVVQLDRMGVYTGTAYADEPGYHAPGFDDEAPSFDAPSFDEVERTQEIPQSALHMGAPQAFDPTDASTGFSGTEISAPTGQVGLKDQVFDAIAPVLGELSNEIRRSLDYYRGRAQGGAIDRVVLTGGSANLSNLAQFLQNELQVPVLVGDPLAGLDVATKNFDSNYLRGIGPSFAVAVGLAVRNAVLDANPVVRSAARAAAPAGRSVTTGNITSPPTS